MDLIAHVSQNKDFYEVLTQIGTLAIATLAFYVSAFQTYTTHKHNKKLVTPYLGGYWETNYETSTYTYTVQNNGLGPAIIKKIRYIVDGQDVVGNGTDPIESAVNTIIGPLKRDQSIGHFGINEYMPQGEVKEILSFTLHNQNIDIDKIVEALKARAVLLVDYESIVGQKFDFDSRKS